MFFKKNMNNLSMDAPSAAMKARFNGL